MAATIWDKFYWSDWANDPKLRLCSMAAQGFWMRLLCICAESQPKGYVAIGKNGLSVEEIATVTGCALGDVKTWLNDLEARDVFSCTAKGTIFSRKMARDAKKAKKYAENGRKGMEKRWSQKDENKATSRRPYNDGYNENITPETISQIPDKVLADAKTCASAKPKRERASSLTTDLKADFHEFYDAYGKKRSPADAEKAYAKARKIATHAEIMAGVGPYLTTITDRQFQAYPASWLNDQAWKNDYAPPSPTLAHATPQPPDWPVERWAQVVGRFKATGSWGLPSFPEPGRPGCPAPREVLERAGFRVEPMQLSLGVKPPLSLVPGKVA